MPRKVILRLQIGIALLFFFAAVFVHQKPENCPTPLSRLDLLHALFTHGTLRIDAYHNTPDVATYRGHTYSDKAPGATVLALPAFAVSVAGLKSAGIDIESPRGWLISSWVACAGSNALLGALGAALLFAWLLNYVSPQAAVVTTLAIFLGAAPLPYATMLFSHTQVVAFVAIALYSIERGTQGAAAGVSPRRWDMLAGFACGWAVASEYTSGLVVGGLFLWLVSHGSRRGVAFCLAAIPPLLLIPLYSWLCFGNPFLLPYSVNESFPAMREGLYAIKWPDAVTGYNLLFSPTRGLLFWTPFLALALVGYWDMAKGDKRLFALAYAVPLVQILVISGRVWDWTAGPTIGPRYLAPILPLLALPCAIAATRLPGISLGLSFFSISLTAFATAVNASPDGNIHNPLTDLHWPNYTDGKVQQSLALMLSLPPWSATLLYVAVIVGGCAWLRIFIRTKHAGQAPVPE